MRSNLLKAGPLMLSCLLAACGHDEALRPDRANFTAALSDYLAQRGHVCLAKYDWPITVPARSHDADAMQMPVLEKLGIVVGEDETPARRRYELTVKGRQDYLRVPVVVRSPLGQVTHSADLCAATLTLDRLIGWEPPLTRGGRTSTSLLFTYRIAPARWAATREALQVFPVMARALEGQGAMQLRLGVHLTPRGWRADELDEPAS